MITAGEGKYRVWLKVEELSDNRLYILGGGERPHIGSVIVKEPEKDAIVIKLGGHYDHVVLKPMAVRACEKYKTTVVAVGGVHVDNASEDEINKLVENCKELEKCI